MAAAAKTEYRTVTMLDGTVVEFPGKRRTVKTLVKSPNGFLTVRFDFDNGETRIHTLRADMIEDYALHGAGQKLADVMAGVDDIDDAIEAMDQLRAQLDAGDWAKERAVGSATGGSILAQALVIITGQTIDTVRTYLATLDNKAKTQFRASPEIYPTVQKLEAEKAARSAARGKAAPATFNAGAALAAIGHHHAVHAGANHQPALV